MFTTTPDLEEQILAALNILFTRELITNITDTLKLNTLKVAPLQDDPTLVAPYLTYGPDQLKGMELMPRALHEEYGCSEIGGPILYLYHYTAICGTPFQPTREQCLAQISNLTNRVVMLLIAHYDLAGLLAPGALVSPDGSKRLENANKLLVDQAIPRLEGGEQTWFGKAVINWHYPVAWYI